MEDITVKLKKNPDENNWKAFSARLKKSNIVYYKTVFGKGKLSNTQDLKKSYIVLYDKRKEKIAEVPIFMGAGKKIEGATIYLKGLSILND